VLPEAARRVHGPDATVFSNDYLVAFQKVKEILANKRTQSRDRIIGARLRAIRKEQAKLSLEAAASAAQWAPARLSRTENGQRQITIAEVATLLTVYQIPISEREEVIAQLHEGQAWWDRGIPGIQAEVGALASYESDAIELINVSLQIVPGLLQTYETAKAIMAAGLTQPEDVENRWTARQRRQQVLGTVDYTAYISEIALHTPFGGPKALRGQLEHLAGAPDRGIGVRVVPARQTAVLMLDTWMWMRFANTTPVVCVEMTSGSQFLHEKDAEPYAKTLGKLDQLALSVGASRRLITDLLEGQL
jgi:transcriptional regulator with XRE-family HTH domain